MKRVISVDNISGGMTSIYPVTAMPPKKALKLYNCYVSERGGIAKINGYTKQNSATITTIISSGFEFRKSDGTIQILCGAAGNIYLKSGTSLTAIKTGLDSSAPIYFSQFFDSVFISNGVDTSMLYDGSTFTDITTIPSGAIFGKTFVFQNRVWAVGVDDKMVAYHSALQDAEDFTTSDDAGYLDFKYVLSKGDELVEICGFSAYIVFVFKNTIVIYSGTDPTSYGDFVISQVIENVGAPAPNCVLSSASDLIILSRSGVKSLKQIATTGNLQVAELSEDIAPTIREAIKKNSSGYYGVCHYPKLGWFLFLIGDRIFVFSYAWKAWSIMYPGLPENTIYSMFGTADGNVYFGITGFLCIFDQTTWQFAGYDPVMAYATAWYKLSDSKLSYPKMLEIQVESGQATTIGIFAATYNTDLVREKDAIQKEGGVYSSAAPLGASLMDEDLAGTYDDVFYMDSDGANALKVPLFNTGKMIRFIFTHNENKGPLEFTNFRVYYNLSEA